MKIFFFISALVLFSCSVMAKNLMVKTPFNHYSLEYSGDKIDLKSSHYHYTLSKTTCNQLMMRHFAQRVEKILHSSALDSFKGDKPIALTLEGKNYYTTKSTKLGIGLLGLPKEVRQLTIQDKMQCKK